MATYVKYQLDIPQLEDANGIPMVGGSIEAYVWNTSTPLAMYTSSAGDGTATSFTLNALGQPQTSGGTACDIFLDTAYVYKFLVKDAEGSQVGATIGPVYPGGVGGNVTFDTLEDLRASSVDHDTVIVTRAVSGGPVVNMELYKDGTGTATTAPNIFSDLAGDIFCNAGGNKYLIAPAQRINFNFFGAYTAATATDNTAAIQLFMTYISAIGGTYYGLPGTYLINGDCGIGDTSLTRVNLIFHGVVFQRDTTTDQYTMFSFRNNMAIRGLKLLGYIQSGTGFADVVPASSFGFRASSNGARNVLFEECEADGLPYDGWYVGTANAGVRLVACNGKNCYRNDFTAVYANSVEIEGGDWGHDDSSIAKVATIDIEPNTSQIVNHVKISGVHAKNLIQCNASNGPINRAVIEGNVFDGADSGFDAMRVQVLQYKSNNLYRNGAVAFSINSLTSNGRGQGGIDSSVGGGGNNLLSNGYMPYQGWTLFTSGSLSATTFGDTVGEGLFGVGVHPTGGSINLRQTVTVDEDSHYMLSAVLLVSGSAPGSSGVWAVVDGVSYYLNASQVGQPERVTAVVKIPAGITSATIYWGTNSSATCDILCADIYFGKVTKITDAVSDVRFLLHDPIRNKPVIFASTAYDPASLADGAGVSVSVTVVGAALGDRASASFSLDTSGMIISAEVSAANTVVVRIQNETGGVLDIGAGTLNVWVHK